MQIELGLNEQATDHIELLLAAATQAFEYVKNDGTVVLSTASPLDDADEYDGDIWTCSGCGRYAGHAGPHFGCPAEGEYL